MKWSILAVLGAAVTPTQKVVEMLSSMAGKGKQEKQDEELLFTRFKQWSADTSEDRTRSIADSDQRIEQLNANIQKAEADANSLGREIADLQANIGTWEADQKAATEVREKENGDYQTTHMDYSESIDALKRATTMLSRQSFDREQAESLMQLKKIPLEARHAITAFLEQGSRSTSSEEPDFLNRAGPQANAYEFQSGGVIDMLEKLTHKFVDEKRTLEREEAERKHTHEMLSQDLTDQIENAQSETNDRAQKKAQREQDAADAKAELVDRTAVRKQDQKYLDDLTVETHQKTIDYENRQKLRGEELEAIQKAIEILSSATVAGSAEKHLPTLLQRKQAVTVLLQMTSIQTELPLAKRVAMFLSDRGSRSNSRLLTMLATQIQSAGPFDKVKKMIWNMIVRLQEEATAETEHKGWCDTELATNKVTRDQKREEVEQLTARTDSLTARIAKLTQEISDLNEQISQIDAAVAEATKNRNEEKTKNAETETDAKEAQAAVSQALVILREFYAKAATATSLVQGPAEDAPETFDAAYKGQQNESEGVLGMLEVIQSDFARLESETSTSEAEAAREYKKFTNDSEVDKATKTATAEHRSNEKSQKESQLNATKKDLAGTQEELDAAMTYYDKLKPSCVDSGATYEDRVAKREEEIQSLKEALRIVGGDAAAA